MLIPTRNPLKITLLNATSTSPMLLWSSDTCHQTLSPLPCQSLYRTLNGTLIDITPSTHHKYCSTLTCPAQHTPFMDQISVGSQVHVECIVRLSTFVFPYQEKVSLTREAVQGSITLQRPGCPLLWLTPQEHEIVLPSACEEGSFLSYRPRLMMRVTHFDAHATEEEAYSHWKLNLEEC